MKLRDMLAAGLMCAALAVPASALTLRVDGADRTAEAKAVLLEDRTYVSLRTASAMLEPGVQVSWEDGTVLVTGEGLVLTARPGDNWLEVNGERVCMEGKVKNLDGTVMIPLRALCEALGGEVDWEADTGTAVLNTGRGPAEVPAEAPEGAPEISGYTVEDLYWLSRIISAESRGEPLRGKLAVGTVVLNRVASREFPDTIHDVIFDSRWGGQFEPVRNGTVYDEPTEESVLAALMCLRGAREAGESLYFLAPALTSNHWAMKNCTYVTTIGCHWFYK